jgi:hypothetical protein
MSKRPVAPSRLLTTSAAKKIRTNDRASIYHICPEDKDGCFGFSVVFKGYAEKCLTAPLDKSNTDENIEFIENLDPIMRTMKFRLNGLYVTNNGYSVKMLTWLCDSTITKDDIESWFKMSLVPSLMNLSEFKLKQDPVLAPDWYNRRSYWSDIIDDEDAGYVLRAAATNIGTTVVRYLKEKKARIYSFWETGSVPMHRIIEWQFEINQLHVDDARRWIDQQRVMYGPTYHINGIENFELDDNDSDPNPNEIEAAIQQEANHVTTTLFFCHVSPKSPILPQTGDQCDNQGTA